MEQDIKILSRIRKQKSEKQVKCGNNGFMLFKMTTRLKNTFLRRTKLYKCRNAHTEYHV